MLRVGRSLIAEKFSEHRHAFRNRREREVSLQPVAVLSVVFDPLALPEGLADIDPALLIKAEGDGVRHQWVGGNGRHRHALGQGEAGNGDSSS